MAVRVALVRLVALVTLVTYLELRSPMFGETCISKSMVFFKSYFHFTAFFVRGVVKNGMCEV